MNSREAFEKINQVPPECQFHDGHYISATKRGFVYELIWQSWLSAEAQFSEVGEMANDARTGHIYNILFDDGNAQAIGTKLYAKSEA